MKKKQRSNKPLEATNIRPANAACYLLYFLPSPPYTRLINPAPNSLISIQIGFHIFVIRFFVSFCILLYGAIQRSSFFITFLFSSKHVFQIFLYNTRSDFPRPPPPVKYALHAHITRIDKNIIRFLPVYWQLLIVLHAKRVIKFAPLIS